MELRCGEVGGGGSKGLLGRWRGESLFPSDVGYPSESFLEFGVVGFVRGR